MTVGIAETHSPCDKQELTGEGCSNEAEATSLSVAWQQSQGCCLLYLLRRPGLDGPKHWQQGSRELRASVKLAGLFMRNLCLPNARLHLQSMPFDAIYVSC